MTSRTYRRMAHATPHQLQPIPGKHMVENSAGGFVFELDPWKQLDRFLVLGVEGGTYYKSEQRLALENLHVLKACIAEDAARVVNRIVEFSESGRTPRNTQLIFALAAVAVSETDGAPIARAAIPRVCRTGTHLFQYVSLARELGGGKLSGAHWKHIGRWYDMPADKLALQTVKYRQREAWKHCDVLNLTHPKPATDEHAKLFGWVINGDTDSLTLEDRSGFARLIAAMIEAAAFTGTRAQAAQLVAETRMPRECLPTEWLNWPEVWEAMLPNMPLTATLRSLGKMSAAGILQPFSGSERFVIERFANREAIAKARIHPVNVLVASKTYAQGQGFRGKLTWRPNSNVIEALDTAFDLSFGNVKETRGNTYLGIDCSGSMGWTIAGMPLTCMEAAAAMAIVQRRAGYAVAYGFSDTMRDLQMTKRMTVSGAVNRFRRFPWGGTDCALPMLHAAEKKIAADTFVIYTDNETWAGNVHPCVALERYRQKMGIDAKLVVCAFTSTGFSIADPNDLRTLDVVGFDSAVPNIVSDFVTGDLYAA